MTNKFSYKPAPVWLINEVNNYAASNGGYLYAPIPHPEFENIPVRRADGRSNILGPYLNGKGKSALDIGMHLGNECHLLESYGYDVTGIEFNPLFVRIAREVRDLCSKKFSIFEGNFFDFPEKKFDTLFALNIFHHFIKTEKLFNQLEFYLESLDVNQVFFQASNPSESQMLDSFRNFTQDEFAEFIRHKLQLYSVCNIGSENGRNMYLIK